MSQPQPPQNVLSEASALRLLNDVVATSSCSPEMAAGPSGSGAGPTVSRTALDRMLPPVTRHSSQESIHSANENGNSCRICRWNRSDMEIIKCPCTCKGSVVSGGHLVEVFVVTHRLQVTVCRASFT